MTEPIDPQAESAEIHGPFVTESLSPDEKNRLPQSQKLMAVGLAFTIVLGIGGWYVFSRQHAQTSANTPETQTAALATVQSGCDVEFKQAVDDIKQRYSLGPDFDAMVIKDACSDLNNDGRPEVILKSGGLFKGAISPAYLVYTKSSEGVKPVLEGTVATEFEIASEKNQGWQNLKLIPEGENSQVIYSWNGSAYQQGETSAQTDERSANQQNGVTRYTNVPGVNIRSKPSTASEVVQNAEMNLPLILSGEKVQADSHTWEQVQLEDGRTGWVSGKFLAADRTLLDKILLEDKCLIIQGTEVCLGDPVSKHVASGDIEELKSSYKGWGIEVYSSAPGPDNSDENKITSLSISSLRGDQPFPGATEFGFKLRSSEAELQRAFEARYSDGTKGEYFSHNMLDFAMLHGVELTKGGCITAIVHPEGISTLRMESGNCRFYRSNG